MPQPESECGSATSSLRVQEPSHTAQLILLHICVYLKAPAHLTSAQTRVYLFQATQHGRVSHSTLGDPPWQVELGKLRGQGAVGTVYEGTYQGKRAGAPTARPACRHL